MTNITECVAIDAIAIFEHAIENEDFMEWLKQGEGVATARQNSLTISPVIGKAYETACSAGYDNCFDWDFIPAFADRFLNMDGSDVRAVADQIAREIASEFLYRESKRGSKY